ncbi:hypothetical protein [Paenibacillus xylanexedens]|uniref:Uncharacterized protein n=1 Tax=Paenibacillus xylanexedens TaxID=528191 RepID=A0ABS4S2D8_PAEXY|nr:hypothetical protein [Paenibacillus xylanexedens]MBP2249293.1 hypothetical protein [Paenibacillus xylanexedens]
MKEFFQKFPLWFWFAWVVVMILLIVNTVQGYSTALNAIAMLILTIANGIRIWKSQRYTAIIFLAVSIFCIITLVKTSLL